MSESLLASLAVRRFEVPDAHAALTVRGNGVTVETNSAAPLDKQSLGELAQAIQAVAATLSD